MGLAIFEGSGSDGEGVGHAVMGDGVDRQVAPLARAGAYVTLAGVGVGGLGIVLPHPSSFNEPALIALWLFSALWAMFFLIYAERLPMIAIRLAPAAGILQVTAAVIFSGDALGAYATFYLWPCFYAFYFLSRTDSALTVAFLGLCYGSTLILMNGSDAASVGDLTHQFVLTVGSLAIAGVMMLALRDRVNALWTRLSGAARTDMLTGFRNKHGLVEVLATEIERARPDAHRIGVLSVSVGGIGRVSKDHGHEAGDAVLKEIGRLLDESTRRIDTVGRIDAHEFAVVLPETDEHTGFLLAEQILTRFRRTYRERGTTLRASLGVASFPKHGVRAEDLMQAAESAAQVADTLGSDRAVVYSADVDDALAAETGTAPKDGRMHLATVLSLAEVLDLRDERNAAHSAAVARYCEMLARELGLPEQRVNRLRLAGMLHDIGKIGIADTILDKPGPLSPGEWDQVRRHPEMAARILGAKELTDIREWILMRHEQLDGHGYPRGISGDEIPLEARILAVAESYDAMTTDRPYRSARSPEDALAEMGRYVGSQFDGRVVDALKRVLATVDAPTLI
ncbi:MAG: diguanylate cyclase [Solirubrobacterales bacterium]|nr:diguanylate cyclase [Solirubrobacterales bacterium]